MRNIPLGATITLDSMIFIYLFEEDRRFVKKVKPIFEKIQSGKNKGFTSVISVIEVLSAPKLKLEKEKALLFERFFYETPNLTTLDVNRQIAGVASQLRQDTASLRTPESIQIATGLINNSDYFITNDNRLKKISLPSFKILTVSDLPN